MRGHTAPDAHSQVSLALPPTQPSSQTAGGGRWQRIARRRGSQERLERTSLCLQPQALPARAHRPLGSTPGPADLRGWSQVPESGKGFFPKDFPAPSLAQCLVSQRHPRAHAFAHLARKEGWKPGDALPAPFNSVPARAELRVPAFQVEWREDPGRSWVQGGP